MTVVLYLSCPCLIESGIAYKCFCVQSWIRARFITSLEDLLHSMSPYSFIRGRNPQVQGTNLPQILHCDKNRNEYRFLRDTVIKCIGSFKKARK